jgi:hypothetical protein
MFILISTITAMSTFWLYGLFDLIGILFFYRVMSETKGRSLEDIEAELAQRVPGAEGDP